MRWLPFALVIIWSWGNIQMLNVIWILTVKVKTFSPYGYCVVLLSSIRTIKIDTFMLTTRESLSMRFLSLAKHFPARFLCWMNRKCISSQMQLCSNQSNVMKERKTNVPHRNAHFLLGEKHKFILNTTRKKKLRRETPLVVVKWNEKPMPRKIDWIHIEIVKCETIESFKWKHNWRNCGERSSNLIKFN